MTADKVLEQVRVDKWIWAVRLVKTRTLAAELCRGGKVEVNGENVKPSRAVRIGDVVQVSLRTIVKRCRVTGLIERRTAASAAQDCYEDLSPPRQLRSPAVVRERGSGRPTKKERRELDRLTDQS